MMGMSNYIMNRESLKRHCEAMCKKFKDVPTSGTYSEHRFVLDLLEQTEWIPVSERLPEERDWYLAVFKEIDTEYQLIPRVADYIGNEKNEWQIIDEDGVGGAYRSTLECVAWMPLPKAYERVEE